MKFRRVCLFCTVIEFCNAYLVNFGRGLESAKYKCINANSENIETGNKYRDGASCSCF